MGTYRAGRRGVPGAWALAVLCAVTWMGCRRAPVQVTGLRVITQWKDIQVDQLEFRVADETGKQIVEPHLRPAQPRTLKSGDDVVIYFPDDLGGTEVRCDIRAFGSERVVGTAQIATRVIARNVIDTVADLTAGPGSKVAGSACSDPSECESHFCIDGVCCQTQCAGACRSCAVPGKQGTCAVVPEGIKHGSCADQGASTCGFDGTCDGLGSCRRHPAGTQCSAGTCNGASVTAAGGCDGNGACVMGPVLTCAPFNCDSSGPTPRCFDRCTEAQHCVPGRECVAGSCGKKLNGAACGEGVECVSGICVDGVCCDSKCDGPCQSCAQVGSPGTCQAVPSGVKDPRGLCQDQGAVSCGSSGSCDGNGGCAKYAAGTICKPPSCMSPTVQITASRCDGAGTCEQGGQLTCAPFGCSSAAGTCNSSCNRSEDCAPGIVCMLDQKSCGKKGLGQPCGNGAECASNFCIDKVCCQDACPGPCRSCSLGAVPGVCTLALAGAPDPRATCVDRGKASCDTDGTCTGSGACRKYGPGTVCGSGACNATTNVRTLPSSCSLGGQCTPGTMVSCGVYRCNGTVCFAGCGSDSDCVPPNVCIAGACGLRGSGAPCSKSSDCMSPFTCIGAACQTKPLGYSCVNGNECQSTFCTDGVCCQKASCGPCNSCKVTSSVGFCQPVPAGIPDPSCTMTPPSTCGHDGTCNGAGSCRFHGPATQCAAASCDGRLRNRPRTCDGAGTCKDSGTTDCTPYVCNPTTKDCYRSCSTDNQCCCGNNCRGNNACN